MKSIKEFLRDRKGVFGLTAIQQFFIIILGLAILAYVIVIILGALGGTTILSKTSTTTYNESGWLNDTRGVYTLAKSTIGGFASPSITYIFEGASLVPAANYTFSSTAYTLINKTATAYEAVNITYSYNLYTGFQNNLDTILKNTSSGISGFFGEINPVYAILAILVIILILVVLVRVVQTPTSSRVEEAGL